METLVIFGFIGFMLLILWILHSSAYDAGYKQGQADAENGSGKYILVEFQDGTREYYKKSELKDLKEYKLVSPEHQS